MEIPKNRYFHVPLRKALPFATLHSHPVQRLVELVEDLTRDEAGLRNDILACGLLLAFTQPRNKLDVVFTMEKCVPDPQIVASDRNSI